MKKYLMMGAAALVLGASFVSCSKDTDLYDPNADVQNFVQKYQEAFVKAFGQPAPNQTWGFSDNTTRSENANANEWADPNKAYGGLLVPPPLTDEQIAVVKEYFQTVKNPTYEDPQWTNYFIQQVYKGYDDPMTGTGYSPEAYVAANGSTYIIGSDHMDHLAAINGDFVDHINNFNHGDCSVNGTVLDNGGNANDGPFHSDKIMYMKESTTASFGYYNSNGSVRRTEYTGLVSFQTIINKLGSKANCLNDGWNRSFMGFDFEQMVDEQCYATKWENNQEVAAFLTFNEYYPEYFINGEKTSNYVYQYNGQPVRYLSDQTNRYCAKARREVTDAELYSEVRVNGEYLGKQVNTDFINGLLADGYLPVNNKGLREWIKVGGCADGYYSDWIVTLTKAETGPTPPDPEPTSLRIMVEDLSATEASDFDFNDVVFDVIGNFADDAAADVTINQVTIRVYAAGGTLPLKINSVNGDLGFEVHAALRGEEAESTEMINTHAKPIVVYPYSAIDNINMYETTITLAEGKTIRKGHFREDVGKNLRVEVEKTNDEGRPVWCLLEAKPGQPACKIGVDVGTPWVLERHNISAAFEGWTEWVQTGTNNARWYGSPNDTNVYNPNGLSITCTRPGCNH